MRNTLEKTTLLVLQNIPTLILFLIPLFFLTNTVDFFAFNKFYLLNILASISLVFWCLNNILQSKISLTLSPTLSTLFILIMAHLFSALFMSPVRILSLTGITTLFISLFIIHLSYTSTAPSTTIIKRQIFALIFSVAIASIVTILHFFNLISPIFNSEIVDSKYFNLIGGIIPSLTFSLSLLIGVLAYIFYTNNLLTKIILFIVSGTIITASIINISLLFPSSGVSPIISLPLKASWSIALDIFKYPGSALIGTGPETYLATFTRLRPNYLNLSPSLWNTRFSESGSFFLTLLTTTGLLGGLAFVLAFVKNIALGLRHLSTIENKPELSFVTASLAGFFIVFLITPGGIVSLIVSIMLLGLITQIFKASEIKNIKNLRFNLSNEETQSKTLGSFLPILSIIISVFLLATYWNFGSRFYKATMLLNEARKQINTDIAGSFLKQSEAQKLNTYDPTYQLVISQTYQQVALFYLQKKEPTDQDKQNAIETMQRTIDAGKQAARLDPFNVLVWENLSNIYQGFIGAAKGSEDLAVSHLAQAIALDPSNPRLRLQLGILYYNLNDREQAVKYLNQAMDLKPNWEIPYLNFYRLYAESKDYQKAQSYLKQAVALSDPKSEDYEKLQSELKKINEMVAPNNATESALPK